MRLQTCMLLLLVWMALAASFWLQQRNEIIALNHAIRERPAAAAALTESRSVESAKAWVASPGRELLKLRGEVALLRTEQQQRSMAVHLQVQARDWKELFHGPKPSEQEGYVGFSSVTNAGHADPARALQSFYFKMGMGQHERQPLSRTQMKEIFDLPDDFDEGDGYNINLGEGISGIGYRIVESEDLGGGEVRLTLDIENPDGSWSRRERVMVLNQGNWRVKPARVWR